MPAQEAAKTAPVEVSVPLVLSRMPKGSPTRTMVTDRIKLMILDGATDAQIIREIGPDLAEALGLPKHPEIDRTIGAIAQGARKGRC